MITTSMFALSLKTSCDVVKKEYKSAGCCGSSGVVSFDSKPVFPLKTIDSSKTVGTTLYIGPEGNVKCSGSNKHGNCGLDSTQYPSMGIATPYTMDGYPSLELGGKKAIEVATGSTFSAVLLEDNTVHSFGTNNIFPSDVTNVASICAGSNHAALLGVDHKLEVYTSPTTVAATLDDVSQVACGCEHMLALTSSGDVYAFGSGSHGQLGSAAASAASFTKISGLPKAKFVAAGCENSGIITESGDVHTWGRNEFGQLGHNFDDYLWQGVNVNGVNVPFGPQTSVPLYKGSEVSWLSMGQTHTLVTFANGLVHGMGLNAHGVLTGQSPAAVRERMIRTNHPFVCETFQDCGKSDDDVGLLVNQQSEITLRTLVSNTYKTKPTRSLSVQDGKVTFPVGVTCLMNPDFSSVGYVESDLFNWTKQGDAPIYPGTMYISDPVTGETLDQVDLGAWTRDMFTDWSDWARSDMNAYAGRDKTLVKVPDPKAVTLTIPVDTHFVFSLPNDIIAPGGVGRCFIADTRYLDTGQERPHLGELDVAILGTNVWWTSDELRAKGHWMSLERGQAGSYYFSGEEGQRAHFNYYQIKKTQSQYRPYTPNGDDTFFTREVWRRTLGVQQFTEYAPTPIKIAVAGYKSTHTMNVDNVVVYQGTSEPHNQKLWAWDSGAGKWKTTMDFLWPAYSKNRWDLATDAIHDASNFKTAKVELAGKLPMHLLGFETGSAFPIEFYNKQWKGEYASEYYYDNYLKANGAFAFGVSGYSVNLEQNSTQLNYTGPNKNVVSKLNLPAHFSGSYASMSPTEMTCTGATCGYIYGSMYENVAVALGFERKRKDG